MIKEAIDGTVKHHNIYLLIRLDPSTAQVKVSGELLIDLRCDQPMLPGTKQRAFG
jgi:hypothetical protein